MMQFSQNGSPRLYSSLFGDVKIIRKFEGYHPQRNIF